MNSLGRGGSNLGGSNSGGSNPGPGGPGGPEPSGSGSVLAGGGRNEDDRPCCPRRTDIEYILYKHTDKLADFLTPFLGKVLRETDIYYYKIDFDRGTGLNSDKREYAEAFNILEFVIVDKDFAGLRIKTYYINVGSLKIDEQLLSNIRKLNKNYPDINRYMGHDNFTSISRKIGEDKFGKKKKR